MSCCILRSMAASFSLGFSCSISSLKRDSFSRATFVLSRSAWASRISRIVRSTCLLASLTISAASARASSSMRFFNALTSSSSFWYLSVRLSSVLSVALMRESFSSRARRLRAIWRRLRSMFTNSLPARASASLTTSAGRPIFLASSKANELPGIPCCNWKSGLMAAPSKSMAPLTTPLLLSA